MPSSHLHPLDKIAWSFAEPIPESPNELIADLEAYYEEVMEERLPKDVLTATSPFTRLDVRYSCAVQEDDTGERKDKHALIEVGDGTHKLTYAEILWAVHSMAFANLEDQDHHYFEGFEPLDQEFNPGVPAFELILGS